MLEQVSRALEDKPDLLAPPRLNQTSACEQRMSSSDSLPSFGEKSYPSLACQEQAPLCATDACVQTLLGVSNAEAESHDARSQRSLKAKGGRKKYLCGAAGPQLGPKPRRWWMLRVGMLCHAVGTQLPCWEE